MSPSILVVQGVGLAILLTSNLGFYVIRVRVANKPWESLRNPGFCLALEKYAGKPWNYIPPLKNYVLKLFFPCINFWPYSTVAFFIPVVQGRKICEVIGGQKQRIICHVTSSLFSSNGCQFPVKCRMKGGWIQAEALYGIIIFFENIVKRTMENP